MIKLADRIEKMQASVTVALNDKINERKQKGADIISLNLGEPDFDTPWEVTKACEQAIESGKTHYVNTAGIEPLRQAISDKLQKDNGIHYDVNEIIVTVGAKQALYNSIMTLCNPGDEVIIPTPCWVSYVEMVKLAGAKPVFVKTKEDHHLDLDAIEHAITEHTKMVIINTPNNPTGAVYGREELLKLGTLAVSNDFYVVSDEVYEKLVYEETSMVSIASLSPEIKNRTITINGFSKGYAMTGWRIGYSAAPLAITKGMIKLQGHTTFHVATFIQYAAAKALTDCESSVKTMVSTFAERRKILLDELQKISEIKCEKPQGAFYVLPDVSACFGKKYKGKEIKDSMDLAEYLLEEASVAVVPGIAFESPKAIRIAYSTSEDQIQRGIEQMRNALEKLE